MKATPTTTKTVEPKRIVGVQKAAAYAGVSRWTIRAWIQTGKLPFVRYPSGRKDDDDLRGAKIDLADLDAFIDRAKDRNS